MCEAAIIQNLQSRGESFENEADQRVIKMPSTANSSHCIACQSIHIAEALPFSDLLLMTFDINAL